jgi:hypothetical protein
MAEPKKCPCCDGWGKREIWLPIQASAEPIEKECFACYGTGVVWGDNWQLEALENIGKADPGGEE